MPVELRFQKVNGNRLAALAMVPFPPPNRHTAGYLAAVVIDLHEYKMISMYFHKGRTLAE